GAAERQRRVNLVLDLDQRVEHHRAAFVEVQMISVDRGILAAFRVPAINLEFPPFRRPACLGLVPGFSFADLRVFWERKLNHEEAPKVGHRAAAEGSLLAPRRFARNVANITARSKIKAADFGVWHYWQLQDVRYP